MELEDEQNKATGDKGLFAFLHRNKSEESGGEDAVVEKEEKSDKGDKNSARTFSQVVETYLPWRDRGVPAAQHLDLRAGMSEVPESEHDEEESGTVVGEFVVNGATAHDHTVVEKILRGMRISKAYDTVGALDVSVRAVTGEQMLLKISAGPASEVSNKIRDQLIGATQRSQISVTLDRVVEHVHLKSSENISVDDFVLVDNDENFMGSPSAAGSATAAIVVAADPSPMHSVLLARIPVAITSFKKMTVLTVEGQQLSSVDNLMDAEMLEELRIINCELRELPAQLLQRLHRLRLLDVRQNLLTSVALGGSHEKIETVCMAHNQITTVPSVLCRMVNLTELDISFNRLSSLPSEMRNMTALTRLNFEGNALVTPSVALIRGVLGSIDVVTKFPWLVHLNLSRNKITELPSAIENLSSLTELVVSDNRLTRVPPQLVAVPRLSSLDLSGNSFGIVPRDVALLKSLTVLRLARTKISAFPQNLAALAHLKELDVSHNAIRRVEMADVSGLLSVTSLDASHNRLESCEFLAELHSLVRLDLSRNAIRNLPAEINLLESLRFLDLSKNQVAELPSSFCQLYNLEEVNFSHNVLESLGSYWNLSSFPRLRVLLLEGNQRACIALHFSFSTLCNLRKLSMLGIVVELDHLVVKNPSRFDLPLLIQAVANVRHPLLLAAFFGLATREEHREVILSNGGVELMLSLCEIGLSGNRPGVVHKTWPPSDIFVPDTARYYSLRILTALTHKMDSMGPRWTIYLHGAPAVLMDVVNRHPDVRFKLLCIRLLGNLALHPTVKSQIFYNKSEIVRYLESVARTSHSDSIKRFCNRTFAIFGICQHFQTSLMTASLGRHAGVRILSLDGGGTRSLTTVEILMKIRDMTGKRISEMFDLVVGTSAGGLVALSLLLDKTLEEMADVYLTRGYMCFSPEDEVSNPPPDAHVPSSWNKTIRPMINLATKGSMYRVKTYERELKQYFGSSTMISTAENENNPKVAVVSTLTSTKPAVPYLCRNYDYPPDHGSRYGGDVTWKLWEVARATSAAPSFFDPFERDGAQLMDGGIVANNPAAIAYHEYLKIWGREVPISLILSVGTGGLSSMPMPKERGFMETLEQLVDAALSHDRVDEMMSDVLPPETVYVRLNPTGPAFGTRLDEIRKTELVKLQVATRVWIDSNQHLFDKVAGVLKDEKNPRSSPVAVSNDESESADDTSFMADITDDEDVDDVHIFSVSSFERNSKAKRFSKGSTFASGGSSMGGGGGGGGGGGPSSYPRKTKSKYDFL